MIFNVWGVIALFIIIWGSMELAKILINGIALLIWICGYLKTPKDQRDKFLKNIKNKDLVKEVKKDENND